MSALQEAVDQDAQMDMTPMIDVVFLMIIFFICIDFRILEAKLPAYLPKDVGVNKQDVEPQEKLNIRIVCREFGTPENRRQLTQNEVNAGVKVAHRLVGHKIKWDVNTKELQTIDDLLVELERIAKDPAKRQRDPKTGESKLMSVVIEPQVQTVYLDVASTLDAVKKAGFEDISFGGGMGTRKRG